LVKEVMGFLNIWICLHVRFAAETDLADGEFLEVALNREFLKLRGRTRIPVLSKTDGSTLNPNKHKCRKMHQGVAFCRAGYVALKI